MYRLIAQTKYGPLTAHYRDIQSLQRLALAWGSESFLIMSNGATVYSVEYITVKVAK